jgi:hypothetical protein
MDDSGPTPERATGDILFGIALGALFAVPAIFAAILSAGAGHGEYVAARALFPVSMLLTLVEGRIGPIAMAIGLIQFPIYGALLRWGRVRENYRPLIIAAAAHLAAAAACFAGAIPYFS